MADGTDPAGQTLVTSQTHPWPATLDTDEQAIRNQANAELPALRQAAIDAQGKLDAAVKDAADPNSPTAIDSGKAITALRLAANDTQDNYQTAWNSFASQLDNIDKSKREHAKQYYELHPNLTQADRDAIQLALDKGKAELDFYKAQKAQLASTARVQAAKDKLDLAQAEYDASVRLPPEQRKKLELAAAQAKTELEQANAENVRLQNVTLAATAPLAGRNALADIVGKELQNQVNAATAAVAPEVATAGAATATAGATKATIEAGHWDEKTLAEINNLVQTGVLTQAQAAEIAALLPQKLAMGAANIANVQAQTARQTLETQQLSQGDLATKIEQLSEAVKNGMDPAMADRAMEDYLSGSTSFDRQKQRETQLSGAWTTALQAGALIPTGQQYLPGTEPGGAVARNFAKLGVEMPSVQLTDQQPFQQYVAAQGIQTQEPVAPARFGPTGSYAASPAGTPTQGGPIAQPRMISAAEMLAQARATAQPAAGGGTWGQDDLWVPYLPNDPLEPGFGVGGESISAAQLGGPYVVPVIPPDIPPLGNAGDFSANAAGGTLRYYAGEAGGVGTGDFDPNNPAWLPHVPNRLWSQQYKPVYGGGSSNVGPGAAGGFALDPFVPAVSPQAAGGTALLPRAFRGVQGTTPTVERKPIFKTARTGSKPPLFAKGRR